MPQSGAESKKPRVVRGFRQLSFADSQLVVGVLTENVGFESTVRERSLQTNFQTQHALIAATSSEVDEKFETQCDPAVFA